MDKNIQIVQLREHDLNRGHNKSRTPIYPNTIPEAIIGLSEYIGNNGASVLKYADAETFLAEVASHEQSGENNPYTSYYGAFIYIEDEGKFYTFDDSSEESLIPVTPEEKDMELVNYTTKTNDTNGGGILNSAIAIDPNKYYLFGTRTVLSIYVTRYMEPNVCFSYTGRFTVDPNISGDFIFTIYISKQLAIPAGYHGITITDNSAELEADHTYEFNILYDSCTIVDITHAVEATDK